MLVILPLLILLCFGIYRLFQGKALRVVSVIPQWERPHDLGPLEIGFLYDTHVHARDLSALLVDLSLRGYITLSGRINPGTVMSTHNLRITRNPDRDTATLKKYESSFLDILFYSGYSIDLDQYLSKDSSRSIYAMPGMHKVLDEISEHMRKHEYFTHGPLRDKLSKLLIAGPFFVMLPLSSISGGDEELRMGIGLLISMILLSVGAFGYFHKKRTPKAKQVYGDIRGFRKYLMTSERRRIDDIVSLEQSADAQKYLPYAMALGVKNHWSKVLDQIFVSSR